MSLQYFKEAGVFNFRFFEQGVLFGVLCVCRFFVGLGCGFFFFPLNEPLNSVQEKTCRYLLCHIQEKYFDLGFSELSWHR